MNELEGIDIGQLIALVSLAGMLAKIWSAGKARDQRLSKQSADEAVWRKGIEMKIEQIQEGQPQFSAFMESLDRMRKEFTEQNEKLRSKLDGHLDRMDVKMDRIEHEARDGREKIYKRIEHLDDKIK